MAEYGPEGKHSIETDMGEIELTEDQKQQRIEQGKVGCLAVGLLVASTIFGFYVALSSH